jgi:L-rhamnose mutarotase
MGWINHIRGVPDDKMPTRQMVACVTRVKPEKEEQYRILHQTVWPGVTDQMVRSNYRNFSIYFVEIGDELYELFYFEYVGSDIDADNNLSKEDPCTLRWWKLTDVCQNPLPDAKGGIWAAMDQVVPVPATK